MTRQQNNEMLQYMIIFEVELLIRASFFKKNTFKFFLWLEVKGSILIEDIKNHI